MNIIEKAVEKYDSFINAMSGLGSSKDKSTSNYSTFDCMDSDEAECLYAGNDIAGKIVDMLPNEMLREGFSFEIDKQDTNELNAYIESEFKRLGFKEKLKDGLVNGNIHGGAVSVIGIKDAELDTTKPVNETRIQEITWITNFDKPEVNVDKTINDMSDKSHGEPEVYSIVAAEGAKFHHSRSLAYHGRKLPKKLYKSNGYWHDSVLNKPRKAIEGYSTTYQGIYSLLHEMSVGIFKIKGLAQLIANGKSNVLTKRIDMVDAKKSIFNSIVIDADAEDYKRETMNLTGIPPVLDKVSQRVSTASEIPHTRLFGDGANVGLGGSGDSELKDWYDHVKRHQENYLKPILEKFVKLILLQKTSKYNKVANGLVVKFNALWQVPAKDRAEIRLKTSQADNIEIQNGVLSADEVAVSRYGGESYSIETQLQADIPRGNEPEDDE